MPMPISNPSAIIFSTSYKYFLNYDSESSTVDIPASLYAIGEVKNYNLTIPIMRTEDFSQTQINFSFDGAKWYIYPFGQIQQDANFTVQVVGSYTGSSLSFDFYIVNQDPGSSHTNTAFTANAKALLFVTPT